MIPARAHQNWLIQRLICIGGFGLFGIFWLPGTTPACVGAEVPENFSGVLTNAQQILDLGNERARNTPADVAISGVVTFPVPGRTWAFVQDATAGILVKYTNAD